jgi:hypothetical protein
MWDGREQSLESQATDATLGHAQAQSGPTDDQLAQIVNFESNVFDAQAFDFKAGLLSVDGATGGPIFLSQLDFFIGINDSLSPGFDPTVFTLFSAWENLGSDHQDAARASIARGEALFNTKTFTITNVNGLNLEPGDPFEQSGPIAGTCTTCHDSPNVGNHSLKLALDIGIADAGAKAPPVVNTSGLPVFTVQCTAGPLQGQSFTVTDLGRAMTTGKCADVGKVKGPVLRGLAARAPYFHNGSAASLDDVVKFYNRRFSIGFTAQEKKDLVAFLRAL